MESGLEKEALSEQLVRRMSHHLLATQVLATFWRNDLLNLPTVGPLAANLLTDLASVYFRGAEIGTAAFPAFTIRAATSEHLSERARLSIEITLASS
jgi:hypothetical protein